MKRLFAILAMSLAFVFVAPVIAGLSGCASVQASQPTTARETLAVAEVSFVGVLQVSRDLVAQGVISPDEARTVLVPRLAQMSAALDQARVLLATGQVDQAMPGLLAVAAAIRQLAIELSTRAQAANGNPA